MSIRDDMYYRPERARFEKDADRRYEAALASVQDIPLSSLTVGDLLNILNTNGASYRHSGRDVYGQRLSMAEVLESIAGDRL